MILNDIITQLQMAAPEDFAQDWDNVGLLVGDRKQDIQKIFIALDANETAIAQAKAVGAQLLLTHHPLIFSPLKKVNCDNFISARVVELLRSQMSYYAMHTNFDAAKMGELAAERMDLNVEAPLAVLITGDIDHHSGIDAAAQGLSIIDAGHYGIEHIFIGYMEQYLKEHLEGVEIFAQERRDPFIVL